MGIISRELIIHITVMVVYIYTNAYIYKSLSLRHEANRCEILYHILMKNNTIENSAMHRSTTESVLINNAVAWILSISMLKCCRQGYSLGWIPFIILFIIIGTLTKNSYKTIDRKINSISHITGHKSLRCDSFMEWIVGSSVIGDKKYIIQHRKEYL